MTTTHYVRLDAEGLPVAWFNDDVYPPTADGARNAAIPDDALEVTEDVWIDCTSNNGLRRFVDGSFVAYDPPPETEVAPRIISDRQFFYQLSLTPNPQDANGGMLISRDEALAAVKVGAVPAAMQPLLDAITDTDVRYDIEMKLGGAKEFLIDDGATLAIAQSYGWSAGDLNAFWLAASKT